MRDKKKRSLNKRILAFLIFCWVVPVTVFFSFITVSYRKEIISKAESLMEGDIKNMSAITSIRIGDAVSLSQRPSYERTWEQNWEKYDNGSIKKTDFLRNVNTSLRGKFYLDERFDTYAFYMYGSKDPDCFGSRVGNSFNSYVENIQDDVKGVMAYDTSYTYVRVFSNRMFIIRNLYTTSNYERFGTLVVELNLKKLFQDIPESLSDNMLILVEDQNEGISTYTEEKKEDAELTKLLEQLRMKYNGKSDGTIERMAQGGYNGYLYQEQCDYYHIGIIVTKERASLYASLYSMYELVALMVLLFVPLIGYGIVFLRTHIQEPVKRLVKASMYIADGNIGIQVSGKDMPNHEFQYLMESFNSMSSQVKYLFDYVYDEKLARKDAQIQALQAQINPHFLNNTLEMMNWQARMSGDTVVSKMIEALGTVLDYRMNRANVKKIHLSEELHCTDAYFYIMSMRFGQRLQIEREIDEELLYIDVPPLILQPIVENAIVHGVETVKNGSILLRVFHDEERIYLQVLNSGKELDDKAMERIQAILEGNMEAVPAQGRHTSIGISNVNERIRLMYGEEYGLTITKHEDGRTVSTIALPYQGKKEEELQKKERSKVEDELKRLNQRMPRQN